MGTYVPCVPYIESVFLCEDIYIFYIYICLCVSVALHLVSECVCLCQHLFVLWGLLCFFLVAHVLECDDRRLERVCVSAS